MCQNSNMTLRLSGHFSIFGLVFFVRKSLLGIARQWSLEKFAILTLKPRSHVRIQLIYIEHRLSPVGENPYSYKFVGFSEISPPQSLHASCIQILI